MVSLRMRKAEQGKLFEAEECVAELVKCSGCFEPVPLYLTVMVGGRDVCRDCFVVQARSQAVEGKDKHPRVKVV